MRPLITLFSKKIDLYSRLTRADKPIGTLLLLWPALTALFIASNGHPRPAILVIFLLGAFLVRSAGCIVNDIADRNFDKHVARTKNRPLATAEISIREAVIVAVVLFIMSFCLVLFLNFNTIIAAIITVLLTLFYPFMKRMTHLPQVWLGLTFNAGVLLAFLAAQNRLPLSAYLLYFSAILLTIAYDTIYAMVDRQDDRLIGIKSTAILFGEYDNKIISFLAIIAFILLIIMGTIIHRNHWYFLGLLISMLYLSYQHFLIHKRNTERCFQAFLNYNHVWLLIFLGTYLSYS